MEERAKKSTGRTGPQPGEGHICHARIPSWLLGAAGLVLRTRLPPAAASRLPAHDRRAIRLVREADVILDAAAKAASESQTHYQRMAAATEELADALDAIMEPLLAVVMPDKAALERGALAVKAFLEAVEVRTRQSRLSPPAPGCTEDEVLLSTS